MPGAASTLAVGAEEANQIFAPLKNAGSLLLAVSGGSDSMALMWLAARWARDSGWSGKLHVATVDHGLREAAADEVRFVLNEAARLGLDAHALKWQGPHPSSGMLAAAREARYELLCSLCKKLQADLVTAHSEDDQAETVLMALARGAGVDGLSAMQPRRLVAGVDLVRPLLGVSRVRLRATLAEAGVAWIDDPTNEDVRHERIRVRKALDVLGELGMSRQAVALSAHRLGRARAALDTAALACMNENVLLVHNSFASIDLAGWQGAADETQVRLAGLLVQALGGDGEVSLSGAEALARWLCSGQGRARTFAGCMFTRRKRVMIVGREPARVKEPVATLQPGQAIIWDGRYSISLEPAAMPVKIFALQTLEPANLPERPGEVPDFVWQGLPVAMAINQPVQLPFVCQGEPAQKKSPISFRLVNWPNVAKS